MGMNFPFIINILEKPNLGRGSLVEIRVDEHLIFQFVTRPDEEFIANEARRAMSSLQNYAAQRNLFNTLNKY